MKLNTCQITKTLLVHKIQIFQLIIFGNEGIDACYKERGCIFYLCVSYSKCWAIITWDHVSIQSLQGCVWKDECWHLTKTLTIWLHDWFGRGCATSIWTHLQLTTR
jgi:hypothetical protein